MRKPKSIQTEYAGYRFRSRLEARWAVFFDACGVKWEYEPEGYDLGSGLYYLPDFLLHGVAGRAAGDLYVEVKGNMTDIDALKINRFFEMGNSNSNVIEKSDTSVLVVGDIPRGEDIMDIIDDVGRRAYDSDKDGWPYEFNFQTIDGDHFGAHPGVNEKGKFELFGDDFNYLCGIDVGKTMYAYRLARQARFEHGETPRIRRIHHA